MFIPGSASDFLCSLKNSQAGLVIPCLSPACPFLELFGRGAIPQGVFAQHKHKGSLGVAHPGLEGGNFPRNCVQGLPLDIHLLL